MIGRRRVAALVVTAVSMLAAGVTHAPTAHAAASTRLAPGAVDRVLVVSVPGVGWSQVDEAQTPHLWGLLQTAAMANLTARTQGRPDLASGYLTLGAGTRAAAARTPIDGAGMEPDEPWGEVTARDAFRLTTGRGVEEGVLQLGIESALAANAAEDVDAEVGALGDALARAGRPRAVIANGDGSYPDEPELLRRYAASALMGDDGVVPAGRVAVELLAAHERAPFSVRYDNRVVVDAFREVWEPGAVVLVEGSDLVRADAFGVLATPDQAAATRRQALRRTDELLGALLEHVDLDRDAVVVVSPLRARDTVLAAVAVHAPGIPAGLLSSASTRRSGFVLLADVAPTLLGIVGLPRDTNMNGSRFTVGRPLSLGTRLDRLTDATSAAAFRDDVRRPTTYAFAIALAVVLAVAAFVFGTGRGGRWRPALTVSALAVLAALPAVYLARLFPLHDLSVSAYWAFVVAVSLAIAVLARALARQRTDDALLVVLVVVAGVLVLDVVTGARLQLSSAFGYSATVGIRVAGYGNIAYAVLGVAAVLLAGMVAHRVGGRRGVVAAVGVMMVALVADVAPFWGSDVGGVLSLVPAFGVTTLMLAGVRIRLTWRATAIATSVTLLVLAVLTAVDASRPADARTHLGRLARQIANEGMTPLADTIARKVDQNLESWSRSEWRMTFAVSVLFVVWVACFERSRVRAVLTAVPELRSAFVGLAVLALLGYAVNDSGVVVPAIALAMAATSLVVLFVAHGDGAVPRAAAARRDLQSDVSTASVARAESSHE
jgi:hypothetical protein